MDEYPEYDFYNSRKACDGKDRRGEGRGMGKEDRKKDKVGQEKKYGLWKERMKKKLYKQDRYKEKEVKMES